MYMIKEVTASAFLLHRTAEGVHIALVWHPRLQKWMAAGGHVEAHEHAAEAVLREILEETGLVTQLVPGPALPPPAGFPHAPVPAPWWISEAAASADNHTATNHIHVDHVFLAWAPDITPVRKPAHDVRWFASDQLSGPGIAEDSRLQALAVMELIAVGQVRLP
jgi:8-oxo-dGTP pyrophosphatase MutT (NUDIX family)